ncbi:MAG: FAD-dependent monooxygenase [Hyphomicrobiales bacterium]|nr:FAD-dependent monooxygenase [Hyphomicrobiales bacterium]
MTDTNPQNARLRAIVVGGGMGGLAAANALIQKGLDVTVYEQAAALGEVGAGIFIYPNSLRQLERMGFKDALAKVGAKVGAGSKYRRMDGSEVGDIVMQDSSGWNGFYGMHRADILEALAAALPAGTVKCGHRASGFSQDANSATVTFENGHSDTADLIVAADGLRSALQPFATEPSEPEYSGFRAYRGLVERAKLDSWYDETHQVWMGDGKHFMVFPVRRGELLNYVGFVPMDIATVESWSAEGDRDELAADFAGWDPMIGKLLDKVDYCFWWGLNDRRPLKSWSNGRLTLLGDAAHPMLPHLGQGVNQAIEDGVALSMLLEGRSSADVPRLLQTYERLRKPRTDMVQTEARKNGMRYDSLYDSIEQRDHEIRNIAGLRLSLYDYDVEKEVKEAMAESV